MNFAFKRASLALSLVIFSFNAVASVVEPAGPLVTTITSGAIQLPAYKTVNLKLDGSSTAVPLYLTGAGMRVKTFFFNMDVYAISSYISTNPTAIDPKLDVTKILGQIRESKMKALEMTMVMNLTDEEIRDAFSKALGLNNINVDVPPLSELLAKINFPFPSKTKVTIVGYTKDDLTDVVRIERPGKPALVAEGRGLSNDFWKVWFADTGEDDNLKNLQKQLINQIVVGE